MISTRCTLRTIGALLPLLTVGSAVGFAQTLPSPPLAHAVAQALQSNPNAIPPQWPVPSVRASALAVTPASPGPWQVTANSFPATGTPANPLLLTDGTVIVHQLIGSSGQQGWYKLTPDINGSYVNGTWSKFASLPAGYGPLFHASEVLPDGRVVINGGEYNQGVADWTNKGAIYYPSFGGWTSVAPPAGWAQIGDAQSIVLDDGTYMLADCCDNLYTGGPYLQALFSGTPPFNSSAWSATGTGKADGNDEEGWTLLPSGKVLTVEAYVNFNPNCPANPTGSEIYDPTAGSWSSAGSTIVQLPDCGGPNHTFEMGPQPLRPDFAANGSGDNVIAFGGTTSGTTHTAIYNVATGTWVQGPNVPSVNSTPYTLADEPAAVLPSGNVLFAAAPSNWQTNGSFPGPTNFWELGPNSAGNLTTLVTLNNTDASSTPGFVWNFLVLPTGQVLAVAPQVKSHVWIYTPTGSPDSHWLPVINTSPTDVTRAYTYQLTGTQFNGLTQGAYYGDDAQANTNYPIVKIINNSTGHVFYERISGFNVTVARNASASTKFTVSGLTETGPSTLYVVANGISSTGVLVTVH